MGFKQSLVLLASFSTGLLIPAAAFAEESQTDTTTPLSPLPIVNSSPSLVANFSTLTEQHALDESRSFIEDWLRTTVEGDNAAPSTPPEIDSAVEEQTVDQHRTTTLPEARELLEGLDGPASLYAHELRGQEAATVYLQGLPLLTFTAGTGETPETAVPIELATRLTEQLNQMAQNEPDSYEIGLTSGDSYAITIDSNVLVEIDETVESVLSYRDRAATATIVANQMRRVLQGAPPIDASNAVVVARASSDYNSTTGTLVGTQRGLASWYGPGFAGRPSASGEIFNPEHMTAAHRYLPFNTMVEVVSLTTGQSVVVRINDRGPFTGGRIIDLSAAAARSIGLHQSGVGPVELRILN